jgi:ribosome-binding ATPase
MNLSVGIVGLPNVGKSTLFNALLKKQQALVANYPFATIEPNIGVVPVPDERLSKLAEIYNAPIVPATVKFVDIAGLVKGANEGAGLGNKFLSHIREVTVIAHVVRAFDDPNIIKEGSVDPKSDYEIVRTELELADLETKGEPLAKKPEIIVLNVAENEYNSASIVAKQTEFAQLLNISDEKIVVICAKIESDLAALSENEQKEYLNNLGLEESGLSRLIKMAYEMLGLISFLTAGEKEVRAWTIRRGQNALEASGEIHTDFMKNFIKADVCKYEDFISAGGWKNAREQGKTLLEGRDYIVENGDVIEFKIGS